MKIYINNKEYELPESSCLASLKVLLDLPDMGVAFAIDETVVPKSEWETTALKPDARITLIRAFSGG